MSLLQPHTVSRYITAKGLHTNRYGYLGNGKDTHSVCNEIFQQLVCKFEQILVVVVIVVVVAAYYSVVHLNLAEWLKFIMHERQQKIILL